jgi:hypothetical protein
MEGLTPHPLDLPRLRSEPAAEVLLEALEGLVVPPPSWDRPAADITAEIALASSRAASDSALAHWLTRLVGSDLWWIEDDEAKEQIWSSASKRMAERCGRTGDPLTPFVFYLIILFNYFISILCCYYLYLLFNTHNQFIVSINNNNLVGSGSGDDAHLQHTERHCR